MGIINTIRTVTRLNFIKGIMLEGISCAGKTSTFNAVKKLHTERADCERGIIALGEHYSKLLNGINGEPVILEQNALCALLSERMSMLERLNAWVSSLGEARRQSRGLFVLLERFYLNHVVAFDTCSQSMEICCIHLGFKCMLLTISNDNIVHRIRLRDEQMNIKRPSDEIELQASDYLAVQERFLVAVKRISSPTLIINTDSMDWSSFAHNILSLRYCLTLYSWSWSTISNSTQKP